MNAIGLKCRLFVLALLVIGFSASNEVWAATVQLCLGGGGGPCSAAQANSVNVAGLQDAIVRIDNLSGDTARVEASDATDRLSLRGAKIVFLQPTGAADYHIQITGTGYTEPPNLAANPTYRLTATNQTFKRGTSGAQGDIVKAEGFVRPAGGNWNQIGTIQLVKNIYLASFNFFNGSYLDDTVGGGIGVARDLKINLFFKAVNTGGNQDYASFPTNGIELKNIAAGGGGVEPSDCDGCVPVVPPPPGCTKSSMLSTSCATTFNTMKAFGCPTCVYDDEQMQKTAKARMFVENNLDNLEQDLARGGGEHLTALTALLDVPETQRGVFCEEASDRYRMQAQQGPVTPEQLVATIQLARESRPISPEKTRDGKRE